MLNAKGSLLNSPVNRFFTKCGLSTFALALACALPAIQAGAQVAVLHPSGAVSVNNVAVTRTVPVFAGDRITTGEGATATIHSSGNQVSLPPDASIVYGAHGVEVVENGAIISTTNGMTAQFQGLTVSPSAGTASEFEVRNDPAGARVTATTGSVVVSDGTQAKSVSAGSSLVHSAWNPTSPLASNGHNGNSDDFWAVEGWHKGGGGGGDGWGGDDHGKDKCRDRGHDRGHHGRGDDQDCECEHHDHHGHPESPIKPCRGDRHDEHCRCDDHGHDWGW